MGSIEHANNARKAKELVKNPQKMINDITRSYDGDGLVAKANQYYPTMVVDPTGKKTELLGNKLLKTREFLPVDDNHSGVGKNDDTFTNIKYLFSLAYWD